MKWLHTDEYQEVVSTLKSCRHFLARTDYDVTYWKWVFISLHSVVQGCMVIALTRSDSFGAINAEKERAWREAYAKGNVLPSEQSNLLSFLDLYGKIKKKGAIQNTSVDRFVLKGSQTRSIKALNSVRNDFIHFTPKGWALELSGAPKIALDCLDVARFLIMNSGRFNIFNDFKEGELIDLMNSLIADFKAQK